MTDEKTRRRRIAVTATAIVLLNLMVAQVHGLSHVWSAVMLEPWQRTFIIAVVCAAPLLAAVLYWTRLRRTAAVLLTAAMLAGMVFGVYFHFVADSTDHVAHRPHDASGALFVGTAALLVPTALLGVAFGAWSWRQLGKRA
jgi:hypothetical protein